MNTVLVSGASGLVGYGILRSLRRAGKELRLIGTSIYTDSVAQGFCDVFEQAPATFSDGYIDWLLEVIEKYHVDLIIPGIEVDVYKWVRHSDEIEARGTQLALNSRDLILLCEDKWVFYSELSKKRGAIVIETSLEADYDSLAAKFGVPFLVKPRRGYASKGIAIIHSADEYANVKSEVGDTLMVQPLIGQDGEEYTAAAFGDGKGGYSTVITLKRKLSKEGFTEKAEVVSMAAAEEAIALLCSWLKPIGPTNFQFITHWGELKLLEINPRISSTTSIRTAFGYNECQMAVEFYLEHRVPRQPPVRKGRAVRYIEDFIFYDDGIHL